MPEKVNGDGKSLGRNENWHFLPFFGVTLSDFNIGIPVALKHYHYRPIKKSHSLSLSQLSQSQEVDNCTFSLLPNCDVSYRKKICPMIDCDSEVTVQDYYYLSLSLIKTEFNLYPNQG